MKIENEWSSFAQFLQRPLEVFLRTQTGSLNLIDAGAQGGLEEPWRTISSAITAYRFEPLGTDYVDSVGTDVVIPCALWESDQNLELCIASANSTSSVFPPNFDLIAKWDFEAATNPRKTIEKRVVPARSIDSLVLERVIPAPHFIKLDVHSSELAILKGSKDSLHNCVGLMVESWDVEVHSGGPLTFEIEEFCHENGFELLDSVCAASWGPSSTTKLADADKRQWIGTESVFVRRDTRQEFALEKSLVLAAFGFFEQAKLAASMATPKAAEEMVLAISHAQIEVLRERTTLRRLARLLQKRLFAPPQNG